MKIYFKNVGTLLSKGENGIIPELITLVEFQLQVNTRLVN